MNDKNLIKEVIHRRYCVAAWMCTVLVSYDAGGCALCSKNGVVKLPGSAFRYDTRISSNRLCPSPKNRLSIIKREMFNKRAILGLHAQPRCPQKVHIVPTDPFWNKLILILSSIKFENLPHTVPCSAERVSR